MMVDRCFRSSRVDSQTPTIQANGDDFATTNWSSPGVSCDTSELNVNELAKLADVSSIG